MYPVRSTVTSISEHIGRQRESISLVSSRRHSLMPCALWHELFTLGVPCKGTATIVSDVQDGRSVLVEWTYVT